LNKNSSCPFRFYPCGIMIKKKGEKNLQKRGFLKLI
jgi:hypothetical protein